VIVVDASALLEALLQTPAAIAVEERLFDEGLPLHAPHLIDVELAQVLRRSAATGQIEPARCRDAVVALAEVLDARCLLATAALRPRPASCNS
jgi:predicted nucleic acid-binding protein